MPLAGRGMGGLTRQPPAVPCTPHPGSKALLGWEAVLAGDLPVSEGLGFASQAPLATLYPRGASVGQNLCRVLLLLHLPGWAQCLSVMLLWVDSCGLGLLVMHSCSRGSSRLFPARLLVRSLPQAAPGEGLWGGKKLTLMGHREATSA